MSLACTSARTGRHRAVLRMAPVVAVVAIAAASCSSGSGRISTPTTSRGQAPGPAAARSSEAARHPCSLVSKNEAQSILRARLDQPVVAVQGPTCVFKMAGGPIAATITVEAGPLSRFVSAMKDIQSAVLAKHQTFCGTYGSPILVSEVGGGSLLVVSAPCPVAQRLAAAALTRLPPAS